MKLPPPIPPQPPRVPPLPPRSVQPIHVVPLTADFPTPWFRRPLGVLLIALLLCGSITGAYYGFRWKEARKMLPSAAETAESKRLAMHDAFTGTSVGATPAELTAIKTCFSQLQAGNATQDRRILHQVCDGDRLGDEILRLVAEQTTVTTATKNGVRVAAREGLVGAFEQQGYCDWIRQDLRKVIFSADRSEALVYDKQTHPSGVKTKTRWWLRLDGKTWRIYDTEQLDSGVRLSTMIGQVMAQAIANNMSNQATYVSLFKSMKTTGEAMQAGKLDAAETALQQMEALPDLQSMPAPITGLVRMMRATIALRTGKYKEALAACDQAEALNPDIPMLYSTRAEAQNKLGNYAQAAADAQKWVDALGSDEEGYYQLGYALEHQSRLAEAADAFGKSMDDDVNAVGSFQALARVLPDDRKQEIAARFAKVTNDAHVFNLLISPMQRRRDLKGMEVLLAAYREKGGDSDPWLHYYDGELSIIRGNYSEAAGKLKPIASQFKQSGKENFLSEYVYASFKAGESLEAYKNAPDAIAVFRGLAQRLASAIGTPGSPNLGHAASTEPALTQIRLLRQLVELHKAAHPQDPWAYYYEGRTCEYEQNLPSADAPYAKAYELATEADRTTIFYARINARYKIDGGLSAYSEVAPKDETFYQLAMLLSRDNKIAELSKLIEARRSDAPDDKRVMLWSGYLSFLKGDNEEAIRVLGAYPTWIHSKWGDSSRWREGYVRSLLRAGKLDDADTELKIEIAGVNPLLAAALQARRKNAPRVLVILDDVLKQNTGYTTASFYADPDLASALADPSMESVRTKFPREASTQPAPPN